MPFAGCISTPLKELRHAASEQEKRHHAESMEMIDTFSRRVGSISKTLADTRAKLDRAESELSTLRGDKAALQYKVHRWQQEGCFP